MSKMYILVNSDIKISKGKLAGQVGHAVASYMFNIMKDIRAGCGHRKYEQIAKYMDVQKKILLKCSEEDLLSLESTGEYIAIRDKGLTHLEPNTLTCINMGIYEENDVPELIRKLKLY